MSGNWRRRARERVGAEVEARLQELMEAEPLSSDELETAMRVNRLAAMQAIDPEARLDEELTIRLMSEEIPEGLLMPGTADPILRNLQKVINVAGDAEVQLGLVGISSGSTVLHVCPVYPHREAMDQTDEESEASVLAEVVQSPVDTAMQRLIGLIDAAESDEPLEAEPTMLEAFEGLIKALDKSGIDVDLGWHADSGSVRTGRLTSEGRQHAQRRMRPQIKRSVRTLQGYVTELSAPSGKGRIVLRASMTRRTGHKIEITTDELIALGLAFGEWISVEVVVEERIDPLSGRSTPTYSYHSLIERRR